MWQREWKNELIRVGAGGEVRALLMPSVKTEDERMPEGRKREPALIGKLFKIFLFFFLFLSPRLGS